ncbi:MAG: DUF2808 domain-containing protein [Leptolyngbyaceae cyanobacterium CSU_1_3]|nr:DUF2808 domain-containing protein [Leptolyngbyaceae cyanobacterium CSU_1_3]
MRKNACELPAHNANTIAIMGQVASENLQNQIFEEVRMGQIQKVLRGAIVTILLGATTVTAADGSLPINASAASRRNYTRNATLVSLKPSRATVSNENTYSFTMTLPEKAERFARLSFSLTQPDRNNAIVPMYLNLQRTSAFVGDYDTLESIGIKEALIDETGTIWVEFNSPMPPKAKVTVVFKAQQPLSIGQYAYSIAAYPDTASPVPLFVGDGTLTIPQ